MNTDFEDYLDSEVFDEKQALVGTFTCYWTDEDDQAQFLGIKLNSSPDRTCVVPAILGTADEHQSCILIRAREQDIARAPSLGCDEQLDKKLEEQIYLHFELTAPHPRHELHINRSHAD